MTAKKGYTTALAKYVAELTLDRVPKAIVEKTKLHILDGIGCGIHGSTLPWSKQILEVFRQPGGPPEATVWGEGCKLPVASAALINGSFNHAFELDDVEARLIWTHPTGPCLAASLAMGERFGGSGAELLAAVIAGTDVTVRTCVAINLPELAVPRGLHPFALAVLGPAASAARMLRHSTEQVESSFGIAGTESSASEIVKFSGSHLKRLYAGRLARTGVEAALLTDHGFYGPATILEGDYGGMFVKYWGLGHEDKYDFELLTKGLGVDYSLMNRVGIKPYPAHIHMHVGVDLALQLRREHRLTAEDVQEVIYTTRTRNAKRFAHYEPADIVLAQQSIPFTVASALVHGEYTIDQVREKYLRDSQILEVARKIKLVPDASLDEALTQNIDRARMEIKTTGGKSFSASLDNSKGSVERPLTKDEVLAKYFRLAQTKVQRSTAQAIADIVFDLENLRDVTQLAKLTGAE